MLTFTGLNWKCHVIIVIKTDLSGFVVTMHSGLCEQYVKSLGLTPSGFDFLFRTRPRALWQQTPRTGLNPLSIAQCPYNDEFLPKYSQHTPHACFLWFQMSLHWSLQYHVMLDCLIMTRDCMSVLWTVCIRHTNTNALITVSKPTVNQITNW